MGWGNCGEDSQGRSIGYCHDAICDFPGCEAKIHRGLAYACGGMHGEDEYSCEKYFCEDHRQGWIEEGRTAVMVCADCERIWREENPKAAEKMDAA